VIVADPVERRCQVCVKHPPAGRADALGCLEDGLDRVVAAAAGPETIRPRLEPRFPLWLQRVGHPRLLHAVGDHRDAERTLLPAGLGDIDPPDRPGRPRLGLMLHPVGQVRPGLRGQRHLPVDTRRPAASIELGHSPHADQRVGP